MADTYETIADIIAEKRRRADEITRDCAEKMKRGKMVSDCYTRELVADIRREADRLEAAHKRELSKNVSKNGADFGQLGDAAKLREALERLYNDFCTGEIEGNVVANRQMIRDALAAPPRNCDRFATVKDAARAFARERQDMPHPCPDFTFSRWLLTPVTMEGETK